MDTIEYLSPKQIVDCHRYPFTMGQIRHILLYRHKNGLSRAVRKIGRCLVLRKDLWEEWIENQKEYRGES